MNSDASGRSCIALFLPSVEGGGAERVFVELANELAALDCPIDLVLASARGPYLSEVSPRVRVIDLGASGVLRALPQLWRYLRRERPAAMLSALDHANAIAILACVASLCSVRCVVSVRSVPSAVYRDNKNLRNRVVRLMTKILYRFADQVIANSRAGAADLSQAFGVPAIKMRVIYNPLDVERIERMRHLEAAHPWLIPGGTPLVLGVGSLLAVKDFSTLIRAFSLVRAKRNCRLAILGEGPERARLESLARDLGVQRDICLPGFVSNPFVWIGRASVLVSSSLTEGCPNVIMQALACETPIVSTDCWGGSSEILEGGRWGRLVPVGDVNSMADAILETLDSSSQPLSRVRAQDFALSRIARQYLQALLPCYPLADSKGPSACAE